MAKKIRFPLVLAEETQVRTLDELREHFDLERVLEYYKNGKLLTWLEVHDLEEKAEAVRALDETDPDFQRQFCAVFEVEYTGDGVDLKEIEHRQERLKRLRTITDEAEFIRNIDRVAFDQKELTDLLLEGETRIYLCGEKFTVPASHKGITYVGIKNPTVHISGNASEKLEELGIEFEGVNCDNLLEVPVVETAVCNGELPKELLKGLISFKIIFFYVLDHYFLYRQGSGTDAKWVRHEIASGEETVLPDRIAHLFTAGTIFNDLSKNVYDNRIACGDEIAYATGNSCSILNLHTLKAEEYRGFSIKNLLAFSADYVIASDHKPTGGTIEIYSRHPQCLSHKIEFNQKSGITLDGKIIENERKNTIINSSSCRLCGNKLYFEIAEYVPPPYYYYFERQLTSLDLDTLEYTFYQANIRGNIIKTTNNYAYLIHNTEFSTTISAVNLKDNSEQKIIQSDETDSIRHNIDIVKATDRYIIGWETKDGNSELVNLFAIDLSTCRVKRLPCDIEYFGVRPFGRNRCILLDSTLYCFRYEYETYKQSFTESITKATTIRHATTSGIDCKFDLTEEYPQPEELKP